MSTSDVYDLPFDAPDEPEVLARLALVAPERKEARAIRHRARVAVVDGVGSHAGALEQDPVGALEVDARLAACGTLDDHPLGARPREAGFEGRHDLRADLEAARPDGRAERDAQVGRPRAEVLGQRAHRRRED